VPRDVSSLARAIADPGFTPSIRDVGALVDLLADADETRAKQAERAIERVGPAALAVLQARLGSAKPPLRGRIVRAAGRLAAAGDAAAQKLVRNALDDADEKTRRNAAIAIGHIPPGAAASELDVESALLRAWDRDARREMRRSIAASLGKVGSSRSLPLLRAARDEASRSSDAEMGRIAARAVLMIERTQSRVTRGALLAARAPAKAIDVLALARRGLEDLLAEELSHIDGVREIRVAGPGRVRASLAGPMEALFGARTMSSFCFPMPTEWVRDGEYEEDAIVRAVTGESARAVFATWTEGAVRYRIAWAEAGHKRARTWALARALAERAPDLVNDPTASLWEIVVGTKQRFVDVAIAPRALDDPRFSWRRKSVPAASHPTIAAALARAAGVRDDDVVWDPFVGSGAELVERARLGPWRALLGSDLDARSLAAAGANLGAAGVSARLEQADALVHSPAGVTLIVTNPPMGRRAMRASGLPAVLDRFVAHAASILEPGGRLVWIAPWPKRSRTAAAKAGLSLEWARTVDMGGFEGEMQRWLKPRFSRG
jgi:23S rRNA G2445 N2-methylase RlmL